MIGPDQPLGLVILEHEWLYGIAGEAQRLRDAFHEDHGEQGDAEHCRIPEWLMDALKALTDAIDACPEELQWYSAPTETGEQS